MMENRVKRILREGGMALGAYVGGIADPQIVEIIGHAGFDAAFIDADHQLAGVTLDWQVYGPMCRLVAFHDTHFVTPPGYRNHETVDVPLLWNDIKRAHQHEEFFEPGGNMGIGVLWHGG